MRLSAILAVFMLVGTTANSQPKMKQIEFLTRSECVQTKLMRVRTDAAIKALALRNPYRVVDLDTLPATDVRRGYPTPTVLVDAVDLFGMPKPTPPFPEPT